MSYSLSYTKKNFKRLSFLVYGLGSTGNSVINYFEKRKILDYVAWDDNAKLRKKFSSKITTNLKAKLENVDYIVLSPGISLKKTKYKKYLIKYKHKIISDLDLFYIQNSGIKSIVVTGTNGKSTTCKIIEHLLKKNGFKVKLGGNIGEPILNIKYKKNTFFIIEASSFQLSYSKFVKPKYALIINFTNDHLDWHGKMQNYLNSKLKIFKLQDKNDVAFLKEKKLIKKFKKNKYLSKLIIVSEKKFKKIKNKINNEYLKLKVNEENMSFAYQFGKILKINDSNFIKSFRNFKGLSHRYELFYKKNNVKFINDSKATSFKSSSYALDNNKNIFWIVGGLPKLGDKLNIKNLKDNITKSFIIGKYTKLFEKQLKGKVDTDVSFNLNNAVKKIFNEIKKDKSSKNKTVLFSPASASYDQFKNFKDRGNKFKNLVKFYAKNAF